MQQRMKRGAKRALAMAVTVCLLVMASACTEPKLAADSFDDFCTRVIREMVGEDYVTIHFFFDDPDALGLGDVAPTFGRYTAEVDEEEAERSAAMSSSVAPAAMSAAAVAPSMASLVTSAPTTGGILRL